MKFQKWRIGKAQNRTVLDIQLLLFITLAGSPFSFLLFDPRGCWQYRRASQGENSAQNSEMKWLLTNFTQGAGGRLWLPLYFKSEQQHKGGLDQEFKRQGWNSVINIVCSLNIQCTVLSTYPALIYLTFARIQWGFFSIYKWEPEAERLRTVSKVTKLGSGRAEDWTQVQPLLYSLSVLSSRVPGRRWGIGASLLMSVSLGQMTYLPTASVHSFRKWRMTMVYDLIAWQQYLAYNRNLFSIS